MKILVIIPAFNSEKCLPKLIANIKEHIQDILVIDDGSIDRTALSSRDLGVPVIRHDHNMGKGAALKSGFKYAVDHGYEYVITIDSDGQHDPDYIPLFLKHFSNSDADLIIGSRRWNKLNMPWDRRFSNYITSRALSLMLHRDIEDSQSGYRLISIGLIRGVDLKSNKYELESEIIIKAIRGGFKIAFLPIQAKYGNGHSTSINRLLDTLRWVRMIFENL